jgi:GNAT superfamily N-acetyltransferase
LPSNVGDKGTLEIRKVDEPRDWACARSLIEAYGSSLGVDLTFQGFAREVDNLAAAYPHPGGVWLAWRAGPPLGCVALRPLDSGLVELKRLFALPPARSAGVGRALVASALAGARAAGMRGVRLDTLAGMDAAQALYVSLGFRPIAPYRENPFAGAQFLELAL